MSEISEKLAASIADLIPKSLDDIIRLNLNKAQLRLTNDEEILELYHSMNHQHRRTTSTIIH